MRTITASQLIAELEQLPPGALVAFASNYGDRCRTQQVHSLKGDIEKTPICRSSYSDSGYAVDSDGDWQEGSESSEVVWLIS